MDFTPQILFKIIEVFFYRDGEGFFEKKDKTFVSYLNKRSFLKIPLPYGFCSVYLCFYNHKIG